MTTERPTAGEYRDLSEMHFGECIQSKSPSEPCGKCFSCKTAIALSSAAEDAEKMQEMREALGALCDKLDAVGEACSGIFMLAKIHGAEYDGPTWVNEVARARTLLGGDR